MWYCAFPTSFPPPCIDPTGGVLAVNAPSNVVHKILYMAIYVQASALVIFFLIYYISKIAINLYPLYIVLFYTKTRTEPARALPK